jgi:hypothetical protein
VPKKKINYREGTCFFVPLRNGGFARGIVARCDGGGRLFAYFFGPKLKEPANGFADLSPDDAVLAGICGDPGLLEGEWPQAGELGDWQRARWPFPPLFREDEPAGKAWLSYYDEDSLDFVREESAPPDSRHAYPYDRLMGYGSVEIRLTKLLGPDS